MMSYVGSTLWQIRQVWGSKPLMFPGCAVIVVNDAGQILLGYRTAFAAWSIIGGSMELGETVTLAMIREVKEETGCSVASHRAFGVMTNPIYNIVYPHGDISQSINTLFEVWLEDGELQVDEEHSEFRWFNRAELPDVHHLTRRVLEMYADFLKTSLMQVD